MSMLLPTDFFASAPSMRLAPRCSVQSANMDLDDVTSLLFGGGGHDPLDTLIPRLSARVIDVAELHHARRAAALLERRRQEQVWALQQQRQRQREAELRQAYAARQAALERERQHQLAAYVAALVEHQQQLALEEEQARREAAQRARLAEMQKQRAVQQAQRQKALQRQAQLAYEREIMAMLEAQQQQHGNEQKQRQAAAPALTLEDALHSVLGPLAQLFAVEQPHNKGNDATAAAAPANDKEQLKFSASAPESESVELDIVEAAVEALKADACERVEAQVQAAPQVVAAPTAESVEPAPVATAPIDVAPVVASEEQLLYSYAVPAPKDFNAASLNLAVDTKERKVTVSGLWSSPTSTLARPASPTPSAHSHTSGSSKRSTSRRRSRVADVDENGEEIIKPDEDEEDEEDFVDVGPGANNKHSITVNLPQDADAESIRAHLDDEGLKLYYKQTINSLDLD